VTVSTLKLSHHGDFSIFAVYTDLTTEAQFPSIYKGLSWILVVIQFAGYWDKELRKFQRKR
jgi:hypothetical protein